MTEHRADEHDGTTSTGTGAVVAVLRGPHDLACARHAAVLAAVERRDLVLLAVATRPVLATRVVLHVVRRRARHRVMAMLDDRLGDDVVVQVALVRRPVLHDAGTLWPHLHERARRAGATTLVVPKELATSRPDWSVRTSPELDVTSPGDLR